MGQGTHFSHGIVKSNPLFPAFGDPGTNLGQGSSLSRSQVHFSPVPLHKHGIHSMILTPYLLPLIISAVPSGIDAVRLSMSRS